MVHGMLDRSRNLEGAPEREHQNEFPTASQQDQNTHRQENKSSRKSGDDKASNGNKAQE